MSEPAWEVPFGILGKAIEAIPVAAATVVKDVATANSQLPSVAKDLDQFLSDATVAVTDKFLNISLDVTVAKDFMATLAAFKSLVAALS